MKFFQKTVSTIGVLVLILVSTSIKAKGTYDYLYRDLPFSMSKVKAPVFKNNKLSVVDFGGLGDGYTLNTQAFSQAVDALSGRGGGTLIVPPGVWFTGPIVLKSNINLHLEKGALILFSPDFNLYPLVNTIFEGLETRRCQSPISARNAKNIAITGQGSINGSGEAWRPLKKSKVTDLHWKSVIKSGGVLKDPTYWFPSAKSLKGESLSDMNVPRGKLTDLDWISIKDFLRPAMINFIECENVMLQGILFENSPSWNIHPLMCTNLIVDNISVRNPSYAQNGDGIDVESCKNVLILNSNFDVGDDAICIKSGKDEEGRQVGIACENIRISNCRFVEGFGVAVGSEMSGSVRNVLVQDCTCENTYFAVSLKSPRGRGGIIENIKYENITQYYHIREFQDCRWFRGAINIDMFYSHDKTVTDEKIPRTEGTPSIQNVLIKNISVDTFAGNAIFLYGLPEQYLKNITLDNITATAKNGMKVNNVNDLIMKDIMIHEEPNR